MMNSLCLDTFFIDFGKIWLLRKSLEISGKTKPFVFYIGSKFCGKISGDFRRRSMSSLGHQKMMKSEDVKIGNIIISQSRCYLGCGKI